MRQVSSFSPCLPYYIFKDNHTRISSLTFQKEMSLLKYFKNYVTECTSQSLSWPPRSILSFFSLQFLWENSLRCKYRFFCHSLLFPTPVPQEVILHNKIPGIAGSDLWGVSKVRGVMVNMHNQESVSSSLQYTYLHWHAWEEIEMGCCWAWVTQNWKISFPKLPKVTHEEF